MKRVLTIHDLIPLVRPDLVSQEWIQGFKKDILSTILKDQDFIICVSNHTKQQVCEHLKIPPSRVFVTPLGASSCFYYLEDKPDIYYQSQLSKITEKPYFLGTASSEPRKNTQFLINCFCDLIQSQFNLEINLVLVGSLQPSQIEYINNINQKVLRNTKSRIYCTDYVSDQDLNLLYNQSVAFVFPSLYEGFGLPVLEALQCGTPVICSNVTALPEVVGNAAVLIDPKNSDALKQAMLDVLNDSEFRSSLSLKAIHRARAFSWKKCADRTVEAYHSIVQDY